MKIDGREIAQQIFDDLKKRAKKLKENGIVPHLYIITLTTDEASKAYVSQKKLKGTEIGAEVTVENLNPKTTASLLSQKIKALNNDPKVHGIIVQRPLPLQISETEIARSIDSYKDVDGFNRDSRFMSPIALSVLKILEKIQYENFNEWLKSKKITVVGQGVTAGGPIILALKKLGIEPEIVTSKTDQRKKILKNSDIAIAAVGKPNIVKAEDLKDGVILIGTGMSRGEDGKFHGDYDEDEIKDTASFYTPTPGGVGPVNVAMLLSNLIKAAENQFLSK
ncbi:MAG: bifunctional 5,10-methylenetetrahydrofolate dehydrogenase/5,10-methenyltetrahydrofolate cyclohydrolase [Patescibacteria group bacterium]|nr:bifunctional 5,10-methylenetetrahydrofolate dehydrogenase/5,10-methenyltetrahydrofolate cyclohydrolase [Patescibacteria group bacterium]